MDKKEILDRLKELFGQPEVKNGFSSKEACLSWANRVAPLLRFNQQYHQTYLYYLQIIHRPVSHYTAEPAFQTMLSQVEMAIEELKMDITAEAKANIVVETTTSESKTSVLKLEPNLYGIGLNPPELWRRIKKRFSGKKREP